MNKSNTTMKYNYVFIILIFIAALFSCEKSETVSEPDAYIYANPDKGSFTTLFTFDASQSVVGVDDSDLKARWDWEGDGIYDTEYSSSLVRSHRFDVPCSYNVTVQVMNNLGWTDTEVFPIVVYSDSIPPDPSFSVYPGDTANVNTVFTFNASGSFDPYTPLDHLKFRWDWQSDGIWDTPFINDTIFNYRFDNEGIYRVRLEVKNDCQVSDTISRLIYAYDI